MKSFFSLCACLTVAAPLSLFGEATLRGTVADPGFGPIPGATIIIRWDLAGHGKGLFTEAGLIKDVVLKADFVGRFSVDLPAGFYDVFVSSSAFTPVCKKIHLRDGQTFTFDPLLPLDPQILDENKDLLIDARTPLLPPSK